MIDGLFVLDREERFTYLNLQAERYFRRSRSELLRRNIWEAFPEKLGSPMQLLIERAIREHEVQEESVRSVTTGGWLELRIFPLDAGVGVLLRDVTDRHTATQALRDSEARFAGIVALASDAIVSIDEEQRITLFNPAAETMFGYSEDEILGEPLEVLVPESSRGAHRAHVQWFATAAESSRRMGERLAVHGRRKNGQIFPCEVAISRLGIGGRAVFTAVVGDITERVRVQKAHRLLAETGSLLVSTLSTESLLKAVARLTVEQMADWCVISMADEAGVARLSAVAAREGSLQFQLDELGSGDGERLTVVAPAVAERASARGEPLLGSLLGSLMQKAADIIGPVSTLEQLENVSVMVVPLAASETPLGAVVLGCARPDCFDESDLRLGEELARRVAIAVENRRRYAQARAAVAARDEVLRIVSHDLRNPASVIETSAQVLAEPWLAPEQHEEIRGVIQRSAQRMGRLLNDLLEVSRIEAGQLHIERRPISPADLVREVVELSAPLAMAHDLVLEAEMHPAVASSSEPGSTCLVRADRDRVLQVFSNLIDNAIKFTPTGGEIVVRAEPVTDGVQFEVRDTGPGVPAEALEHMFAPFWQARRGSREGAGLGLAIAKGLVHAHGGEMHAASVPGEGTRVFFTLPLAADRRAPAPSLPDELPSVAPPLHPTHEAVDQRLVVRQEP